MDGQARLFVALPVAAEFARLAGALPRSGLDARWAARADYHLTLRYLGDVASQDIDRITQVLHTVRRRSLPVVIDGLDVFDGSVLFARVANVRPLAALAADIGDALAPLGFDPPARPFAPHVTLARLNHGRGLEKYLRRHGFKMRVQWPAHEFRLMQSAKPYRVLAAYPLA